MGVFNVMLWCVDGSPDVTQVPVHCKCDQLCLMTSVGGPNVAITFVGQTALKDRCCYGQHKVFVYYAAVLNYSVLELKYYS